MNLGLGGFSAGVEKVKIATLLSLGDVRGVQGAEATFEMTRWWPPGGAARC
jgi:hypothetical protein